MTDATDSTCVLETPDVVVRDQRQWNRFKPEQTASFLLIDGERIAAEIVDESFDGVGIAIKRLFPVEADEQVELIYHGLPIRGVVCSVTHQGSQTRLGIRWIERRRRTIDGRRPRCRTESDYFLFAGLPTACRIVDQAGNHLTARLPDRTEIELRPEDVRTVTRFQRLADLQEDGEQLRLLTAVYQLGAILSPEDALREVLNLEFAPSWDS
ncbi:MAG: hypothetical protein GXX96_00100 [Planctomycetaceae bacterium]|nr:hypothetical protein [Planctomycetaceae bacterium]